MTHETYVIVVCIIVFALFVLVFSTMIGMIQNLTLKVVRLGGLDNRIEREIARSRRCSRGVCAKISKIVNVLLSLILLVIFGAAFLMALSTADDPNAKVGSVPQMKIVLSQSMSKQHEKNTYLEENDLNNQFSMYDLLIIRELPAEEELELYDIIVYEIEGELVVHRIIGIEEPNSKHSERHFLLKGDASPYEDKFPVTYSQMRGIWEGEQVKFIGSFFLFMRSPGGYLCLILAIFAAIVSPILESGLWRAKKRRWYGFKTID